MANPKEFPGMAHFLEHMLFMGSVKYPTENEYTQYIANNLVVRDFNATAITDILNYFNPQNYQAFLLAQSHAGIVCNETEKYYNISYHISDLPVHLVSNPPLDLKKYGFYLPASNPFMPENNNVKAKPDVTKQPATEPLLLQKDNMHELWFKQDDHFMLLNVLE
ncbi:metalloprotease [Coemansia sp. RSA 2167]|nr:metalloprotease [Coemansia sp. RSA 2167]